MSIRERRAKRTWPTTTAIRTRPACSGHCRPRPAPIASLSDRAPACKVLTLQGVMPRETDFKQTLWADNNGFSLHTAVRCTADERKALE